MFSHGRDIPVIKVSLQRGEGKGVGFREDYLKTSSPPLRARAKGSEGPLLPLISPEGDESDNMSYQVSADIADK